jgi:hypothetical protein
MTFDHLVTSRHLAGLTSALVSVARTLGAVYPDVHCRPRHDEPIEVTAARSIFDNCLCLLVAIDNYGGTQSITEPPKNPDQLDWPF